jgi:BirA family biotin operon repressor/biotin-[acetyl-CoA-carboxylase] ligase
MDKSASIQLIHKTALSSTMSEALSIVNTASEFETSFVVLADTQTNGTGLNNNVWHSPQGGLWFTYCLKKDFISPITSLFTGYCLHKTISSLYPVLSDSMLIKWPNDLLITDKKLAGILIQTSANWLMIGIGINTNNDCPDTDSPFKPACLKDVLGFRVSNLALLRGFLATFNSEFHHIQLSDTAGITSCLNRNLFGIDKTLVLDIGRQKITGICKGVSADGGLLLKNAAGDVLPYYAGTIAAIRD